MCASTERRQHAKVVRRSSANDERTLLHVGMD